MKRIFLSVYLLFFVLIFQTPSFSQSPLDEEIGIKVDDYLSRLVPFGFNGTVLISQNEKILFNKGYGSANPANNIQNSPEIVYSLGSIVKPFTATLIMKLVQDGRLTLSDNLQKFFKNVPPDKAGITIHQLLSHSSGLPGAVGEDDEEISKEKYLEKTWQASLAFKPGSRYMYSNTGFTLLAMIIEKISGEKYEQFLHETILSPAGMDNTGYIIPLWDREKVAHNSSALGDNGSFLDRVHYPTWHLIGNGGMLSTTEDMYRFYLFIKGNELLSDETKRQMFTPVFMEDAYGWVNIDNGEIIQHNGGSTDGNGAIFRWFPKDDIFMMIFTNTTFQNKPGFVPIQQPLERMVFGEEVPLPPKIISFKDNLSSGLTGKFRIANEADFVFEKDKNRIIAYPRNQSAVNLLFNSPEQENELIEWNLRLSKIMEEAIDNHNYTVLKGITADPSRLENEIKNEFSMEGFEDPVSSLLYSIQVNKDIILTTVAVTEGLSSDEAMLMHMYFREDQFAGMSVDFGGMNLPDMTLIPTSENQYTGYNFEYNKLANMSLLHDNNQNPTAVIFNNGKELTIEKQND